MPFGPLVARVSVVAAAIMSSSILPLTKPRPEPAQSLAAPHVEPAPLAAIAPHETTPEQTIAATPALTPTKESLPAAMPKAEPQVAAAQNSFEAQPRGQEPPQQPFRGAPLAPVEAQAPPAAREPEPLHGSSAAPSEAQMQHCLVSLIDDVKVPAEVAGVLVSLEAREGLQVEVGTLLAQINEEKARYQKNVALAEEQVAKEKADNDVNQRYATAAMRVAASELELNLTANRQVAGAISKVEIQKKALTVEQARLQIEQSQHEQTIAKAEVGAYSAKVALADEEIRQRKLKAPLSGEVVEVMFRPGEWVEPGNPVMRIVRLDRLRVEGFLNVAEFSPSEVGNRPVKVTITLARGRTESFPGKITFVNPLVQAGGEYRVWAEVVNRMENGQWLLRPGLQAEMTIDVGTLATRPTDTR